MTYRFWGVAKYKEHCEKIRISYLSRVVITPRYDLSKRCTFEQGEATSKRSQLSDQPPQPDKLLSEFRDFTWDRPDFGICLFVHVF